MKISVSLHTVLKTEYRLGNGFSQKRRPKVKRLQCIERKPLEFKLLETFATFSPCGATMESAVNRGMRVKAAAMG